MIINSNHTKTAVDFGKIANDYAKHRQGFLQEFFDRLTEHHLIKPGLKVLDIGTGTGNIARGLAQLVNTGFFDIETYTFNKTITYIHEQWLGRIRASAGVDAALSYEVISKHLEIDMKQLRDKLHNFDERGFESTQNTRGFMHTLNEISQAFIDFAEKAPGLIVDIGAAYGIATIPIINKQIPVIACDIEQKHLTEIAKRIDPNLKQYLKTKKGQFPDEINFDSNSVGAILLSHILPFLNPDELDIAFQKLSNWVVADGKVFIVCYTPYIGCFKNFLPIYEKRIASGVKWPCWVENNVLDYLEAPENVLSHLPNTMNYLDIPILTEALEANNFVIEKANYLDPVLNNIPQGIIADGREWCGIIAKKN